MSQTTDADTRQDSGPQTGALRRFASHLEDHSGQKFLFAVAVCTVFTGLWSFAKALLQ